MLESEIGQYVADLIARDVLARNVGNAVRVSVEPNLAGLQRLRALHRVRVIRAANRAAKPVRASVIAHAQSIARYGFLAKSIGTKTRIYNSGSIATVIGPKMSFKRVKGRYTRGPKKGQSRKQVPYKYSWLLERGTQRSRKRPFIRPALVETAIAYQAALVREIEAEFERLLS